MGWARPAMATARRRGRARPRWLTRHGVPALVALVSVVILTWPLAAETTTALPYAASDGQEHVWSLWWGKEALVVRHLNPFWGSTIYHPHGTSLLFHTIDLVPALLSIPLQFVVDPTTALVIMLLVVLWLTALATYLLVLDIVHHRAIAVLAGLLMALAPTHLHHLLLGQSNLLSYFPVPLVLLGVRQSLRRRRWPWVAAGALAVVMCGLTDWQFLLQAALLAGLVVLVAGWQRRRRPRQAIATLGWGAAPLLLGLVPLLPLVVAMLLDLRANDNYALRPAWQTTLRSANLLLVVTPNPLHPLWGAVGAVAYARAYPSVPFAGGIGSFPLTALLVAGLALAWRRGAAWTWGLALLAMLGLSLGPVLRVDTHAIDLPMPYDLLQIVPLLSVGRVPGLFQKAALLALAVLMALGLRALVGQAGSPGRGRLAYGAVAGLLAIETLSAPFAFPSRPTPSACYAVLRDDPRPGAVLDLPVIEAHEPQYYQIIHGRPVAGGELSRDNPYPFLYETPVLWQLARGERALPVDIYLPGAMRARRGRGASWPAGA